MTMTMEMEMTARIGHRNDNECQTSAGQYLTDLIGAPPDDLLWDNDHHLQGHAHCHGREIIVIAARDDQHHALVLSPEDWDVIRHDDGSHRGEMMRECAIDSRSRLLAALAAA
jgi:hypothetical protein